MNRYVIIMSCKDPGMWYNTYIGDTFRILDEWSEVGYKVQQPNGFINFIKYEDSELIVNPE